MIPYLLPDLGDTVGFMAHPDDLWLAAAAVLRRTRLLGHNVTSVSATSGEAGSLDHNRWRPDHIGAIREQEEIKAFGRIGVTDVRFLGLADGWLHLVPFETGVQLTLAHLDELRPRTVITYGPDGLTGHDDHQVISAWTTEAFRRADLPGSQLLYVAVTQEFVDEIVPVLDLAQAVYEVPVATPRDDLFIDYPLPPDDLRVKWAGINDHHSQYQPLGQSIGGLHRLEQHWFSRETFRLAMPVFSSAIVEGR